MKTTNQSTVLAQSSFVPNLNNEHDSKELIAAKWKYRMARWENIMKQQFQLSYFGTIDYATSNSMTVYEREKLFELLTQQKDIEKKIQEDAMKSRSKK